MSADAVANLWNETCGAILPKVSKTTPQRRRHATARLREPGRNLNWWQAYFRRIIASPFLIGENDRNWRASFDWAVESEDIVVKVLEGRYDAKRPSSPTPTTDKPGVTPDTRTMADLLKQYGGTDEEIPL